MITPADLKTFGIWCAIAAGAWLIIGLVVTTIVRLVS